MKYLFISATIFTATLLLSIGSPKLAGGIKIGEVDHDSAIVWVRLTKNDQANFGLLPIFTEGIDKNIKDTAFGKMPVDVLPGAKGEIRVTYWLDEKNKLTTGWQAVDEGKDFTHQFKLKNLTPGKKYHLIVEARPSGGGEVTARTEGSFHTAPASADSQPVRFIVTTCQAVRSIDSGAGGHIAYKNMLEFKPHFFAHTGDILYYDKAPLAKNVSEARAKWNLMFAYQHNLDLHPQVSSYFMKDDHDALKNDCWPGQTYGELTFAEGLEIFREQVPMGEKTYRTIRWGKHVQIWLTEHRDFRSPNNIPDGPEKTILGAEQKAWLMRTMKESDATHKFLIVPGPIVGPDKRGKNDNHSNPAFKHEGQELRDFLSTMQNTYVITGDRHWQYASVDPETKVFEMGCGPINDEHMFGGNPGFKKEFHRYFSGKGGFLGITVENGQAKAEWFSAELDDKKKLKILHTEQLPIDAGEKK